MGPIVPITHRSLDAKQYIAHAKFQFRLSVYSNQYSIIILKQISSFFLGISLSDYLLYFSHIPLERNACYFLFKIYSYSCNSLFYLS